MRKGILVKDVLSWDGVLVLKGRPVEIRKKFPRKKKLLIYIESGCRYVRGEVEVDASCVEEVK